MRRFVPLAIILVLAAGCSTSKPGGKVVRPLPTAVVGSVPKATVVVIPPQYRNGDAAAGKAIFVSKGCGGCHTLADANTHGTVGPNLDQLKPPLTKVVPQVINGGATMPPFKGTLSPKQIAAVSAYVVKATGGNASG